MNDLEPQAQPCSVEAGSLMMKATLELMLSISTVTGQTQPVRKGKWPVRVSNGDEHTWEGWDFG